MALRALMWKSMGLPYNIYYGFESYCDASKYRHHNFTTFCTTTYNKSSIND